MNIGNKRHSSAPTDFAERFSGILIRNANANYLAPDIFEPFNLIKNRLDVFRRALGHGLHGNGMTPSDSCGADENLTRLSSINHYNEKIRFSHCHRNAPPQAGLTAGEKKA
jgi:hypothetical protein